MVTKKRLVALFFAVSFFVFISIKRASTTQLIFCDRACLSAKGVDRAKSMIAHYFTCKAFPLHKLHEKISKALPCIADLCLNKTSPYTTHVVLHAYTPCAVCVDSLSLQNRVLFLSGDLCDSSLIQESQSLLPHFLIHNNALDDISKEERKKMAMWIKSMPEDVFTTYTMDFYDITNLIGSTKELFLIMSPLTTTIDQIQAVSRVCIALENDKKTSKKIDTTKVLDLRFPRCLISKNNNTKGWIRL